jgi:8-oxo-dGTP pyrophosphatase MutT (NUDIX family)
MSERDFELIESEQVFDGAIVHIDRGRFRYPDGEEATREIVRHPGAVGIVPVDDTHVWLVRQPREAADDPDSLEIPAGKLDEEGEEPLDTGKRELAEEIGKGAETWEHLVTFFTSLGVMDEQVHVYLATGLRDESAEPPDHNERIEIVRWPLDDLGGAIAATRDSKTIIGLLLLQQRLQRKGG